MRDALVVVDETLKLKIVFQKNTHITISGAVDGRRWHNQNEIQWNKGLRIQRPVSTPPPPPPPGPHIAKPLCWCGCVQCNAQPIGTGRGVCRWHPELFGSVLSAPAPPPKKK
mmetsp:Transcript_109550/g.186207  ORF Transcript_109550/g.186207 Transcript_109550/m.186207 type:complete len:112 (+) Transcript_109550:1644-1979(+)